MGLTASLIRHSPRSKAASVQRIRYTPPQRQSPPRQTNVIYYIAFFLSMVWCAQSVASGIVTGNLAHLKHGREPNAGVSVFPMIPLYQLLALGLAWFLETYIPRFAILVLVSSFLIFFVIWLVSFIRSRAELARAMKAAKDRQNN